MPEGMDALLTVVRLELSPGLPRCLARTDIVMNIMGGTRRVCCDVTRGRDTPMALRWTGAATGEAVKGFRRLQARKQLPVPQAAPAALGDQAGEVPLAPDVLGAYGVSGR